MRPRDINTAGGMIWWLGLLFLPPLLAQPEAGKQLDPGTSYVGAVILNDSEGTFLINASCVALSPTVVLTVAHAAPGFAGRTYLADHAPKSGLQLSFEPNFKTDERRISVDEAQLVAHPNFSGGSPDANEVDLALIFLDKPLPLQVFPNLPAPGLVEKLNPEKPVRSSGFGMHEAPSAGSPFIPLQSDGERRSFTGKVTGIASSGWFAISGYARAGDSGSPVVVIQEEKATVLGLVSQGGPQGQSWITRLDNKPVLEWIRATVLDRIGVTL